MIENDVLVKLIRPVLQQMGEGYAGPAAETMLLAIGLQESGFIHRDQVVPGKPAGSVGPATGFWQFEKNGGTAGVLAHPATRELARTLCDEYRLASLPTGPWEFFATAEGDELACAFARLLLFTDAAPLPGLTAEWTDAFMYYLRNWRPGAWFNEPDGSEKRQALARKFRENRTRALAAVGAPMASPKARLLALLAELKTEIEKL